MKDEDTSLKDYYDWIKYIRDNNPELPKGIKKSTLLAYCYVVASYGYNGLNGFASDTTVGRAISVKNHSIVAEYRYCARGRLADVYGRRRLLLLGLAVFTLSSLAAGLAGSGGVLIASRAIQGVGAALLMPPTLAIIVATFDNVRNATWPSASGPRPGRSPSRSARCSAA
jgi:hypothetical protein